MIWIIKLISSPISYRIESCNDRNVWEYERILCAIVYRIMSIYFSIFSQFANIRVHSGLLEIWTLWNSLQTLNWNSIPSSIFILVSLSFRFLVDSCSISENKSINSIELGIELNVTSIHSESNSFGFIRNIRNWFRFSTDHCTTHYESEKREKKNCSNIHLFGHRGLMSIRRSFHTRIYIEN